MTKARSSGRSVRSGKSNKPALIIGIVVITAIALAALFFALRGGSSATAGIETLPDEGNGHVTPGQDVVYQSEPPTSGQHWPSTAPWGFYKDEAPADELLVHNLEHGGVIISYNPEQITGESYDQLFQIYQDLLGKNYRVILTRRDGLEQPIALTAWGSRQFLDTVDAETINAFFDRFILQGPECVDGRCPA